MKILIVDHRDTEGWKRAKHLAGALKELGHLVEIVSHVNGNDGGTLQVWDGNAKQIACNLAETYDLILLHVGERQLKAEQALRDCYADKAVLCFHGSAPPSWLVKDCSTNKKHCYLDESLLEKEVGQPSWRQSDQWRRIMDYLKLVPTDTAKACEALLGYDPALEKYLDDLHRMLGDGASHELLQRKRDEMDQYLSRLS